MKKEASESSPIFFAYQPQISTNFKSIHISLTSKGRVMPNRYVRESAIESEHVDRLSWAAEVFFRRLINRVDDFGRYTANPELMRASLFPLRVNKVSAADIGKWLSECETADLVSTWKGNDGKHYLVMHRWEKGRAKFSKYPDPPDGKNKSLFASANKCEQASTNVPDSDPDLDPDSDNDPDIRPGFSPGGALGQEPKEKPGFAPDSVAYKAARFVWEYVHDWSPQAIEPTESGYQAWARDCDLMFRKDGRSPDAFNELLDWIDTRKPSKDGFTWRKNVLCPATLRKRWSEGKFADFLPSALAQEEFR
jgi:hypothetical protein